MTAGGITGEENVFRVDAEATCHLAKETDRVASIAGLCGELCDTGMTVLYDRTDVAARCERGEGRDVGIDILLHPCGALHKDKAGELEGHFGCKRIRCQIASVGEQDLQMQRSSADIGILDIVQIAHTDFISGRLNYLSAFGNLGKFGQVFISPFFNFHNYASKS